MPQEVKDVLGVTPLIAFFVIVGWVALKALPTWKEVRLKEIDCKGEELKVRREMVASVTSLSGVFKTVTETTDELKIFLRVAQRKHEQFEDRMIALEERNERIARLERDVDTFLKMRSGT